MNLDQPLPLSLPPADPGMNCDQKIDSGENESGQSLSGPRLSLLRVPLAFNIYIQGI